MFDPLTGAIVAVFCYIAICTIFYLLFK